MLIRFVNVYLVDRAYGGPEEGGWWFDTGQVVKSTPTLPKRAQKLSERFSAWADRQNADRRSDISSVLSEGRYVIYVEDEPGCDFPQESPRYE